MFVATLANLLTLRSNQITNFSWGGDEKRLPIRRPRGPIELRNPPITHPQGPIGLQKAGSLSGGGAINCRPILNATPR